MTMRRLTAPLLMLAAAVTGAEGAQLVVPDAAPWAQVAPDGTRSGIAVEMARTLSGRAGIDLDLRLAPIGRLYALLEKGVGQYGLVPWPGPETGRVEKLGGLLDLPLMAVARDDAPPPTIERLRRAGRIGVLRGAVPMFSTGIAAGLPFEEVPDALAGLKMVGAGRLDAMVISSFVLDRLTERQRADNHLGRPEWLEMAHIALVAAQDAATTEEGRTLEKAWDAARQDGTLLGILAGR